MAQENSFKTTVLILLCNIELALQDKFNQALSLYAQTSSNRASFAFYNRSGFSPERLKKLEYDLKKAAGITDLDVATFVAPGEEVNSDVIVHDFTARPDLDPIKEDLDKMDEDSQKGFKLIVLYPFLDDDDCPDELKILVSDMMKAYRDFVKQHPQVSIMLYGDGKDIQPLDLNNDELFALGAELIDKWQLNEQIDEELRYYAENKEVLGNHPKLVSLKLAQDAQKQNVQQLQTRQTNLKRNISNNKRKLDDTKDQEAQSKIKTAIKEYHIELEIVEKRLEEINPSTAPKVLKAKSIDKFSYQDLKKVAALIGAQEGFEIAQDQKAATLKAYVKEHFTSSLEALKGFEFSEV
ncbi:hypothetical protein [Nonlabens dokdonensis]|uniref:hypothetical protein n=1 Tax=Nonlabens dokdonensis TaxID=328515 RepID=UPI0026EBC01B|nr:hypothetical protein [Nonlabens dokdonensis]